MGLSSGCKAQPPGSKLGHFVLVSLELDGRVINATIASQKRDAVGFSFHKSPYPSIGLSENSLI
jgi:hypothetical protein